MFTKLRLAVAGLLLSLAVCGCQAPSSRWATTSKAAGPQSKATAKSEDREAWPPKSGKSAESIAKSSAPKTDPLSKTTEHVKDAAQLSDLLEKGDRYRKSGQYEEARMAYTGALAISPNSPDVNHRLAIIADKQQQFSLADQFYQVALRARPKDANLLSDLGYSYSLRGSTKQAEKTLKQALAIEPTHRGAMANLGTLYAQQNRYDDALVMFRKGSTTEAEARQNMAKLFPDADASDAVASDKSSTGPDVLTASTTSEKVHDVNQMSVEQLRSELARREQSVKPAKSRSKSWDEPESETEKYEQFQAQLQRTAQRDADKNPAEGTRRTDAPRNLNDSQVLQVGGESHAETPNIKRPMGNSAQSSRLATRIGMNCGPGNLFPIISATGSGSDVEEVPASQGTTSQQESRYRSTVSDASSLPQNNPLASGAKRTDVISKATFTQSSHETSGSTGGVKPAVGASRSGSWRDQLQNSVSWDSDTRDFEDPRPDQADKNSAGLGQTKPASAQPTDRFRGDSNSFAGLRNGGDGSRPYRGSWPKTNDIPGRQRSSSPASDSVPDDFERISVNLGGTPEGTSRGGTGASSGLSTRSPSNWPDAPDR